MINDDAIGGSDLAQFRQNLRFFGREALLIEVGDLVTGQHDLLRKIFQGRDQVRFGDQLGLHRVEFLTPSFR